MALATTYPGLWLTPYGVREDPIVVTHEMFQTRPKHPASHVTGSFAASYSCFAAYLDAPSAPLLSPFILLSVAHHLFLLRKHFSARRSMLAAHQDYQSFPLSLRFSCAKYIRYACGLDLRPMFHAIFCHRNSQISHSCQNPSRGPRSVPFPP